VTLAQFKLDPQLIVAAMVAFGLALMFFAGRRRRSDNPAAARQQAQARIASLRNQQSMRDDLERLLVELQDLSRQITNHIDTRFCKLQVLIKEADEKIRQLQAMGVGKAAGGPRADAMDSAAADEPVDPERQAIYDLADQGKSPVEIAQATGKTTGEIELILSLRRSRTPQHIDKTIT